MNEPNGTDPTMPESMQLELPPAQGHIIISLLPDGSANFKMLGVCLTPMIAHWLLELAQESVKAQHEAANTPRVLQPGGRPGPGSPGWRPR